MNFSNSKWFIVSGAALGALGALLVYFGNPGNMGRLRGLLFARYGRGAGLSPRRSRAVRAPGDHRSHFGRLFG